MVSEFSVWCSVRLPTRKKQVDQGSSAHNHVEA